MKKRLLSSLSIILILCTVTASAEGKQLTEYSLLDAVVKMDSLSFSSIKTEPEVRALLMLCVLVGLDGRGVIDGLPDSALQGKTYIAIAAELGENFLVLIPLEKKTICLFYGKEVSAPLYSYLDAVGEDFIETFIEYLKNEGAIDRYWAVPQTDLSNMLQAVHELL